MRTQATPTVQIDNERAIVTEWRFPANSETGWHTHGHDYVVVPMTNGTLHLETDDGLHVAELVAGVAYARQVGVRHNVINPGPGEVVFIEIEMR